MDANLLDRFDREPSWNFQVIRFLDRDSKDIIPRRDQVWTIAETAGRMAATLEKMARPVPLYLKNLILEEDSKNLRQIAFAMFCFWTGEYTLGKIDGVVTTEAGFFEGREVSLMHCHRGESTQGGCDLSGSSPALRHQGLPGSG